GWLAAVRRAALRAEALDATGKPAEAADARAAAGEAAAALGWLAHAADALLQAGVAAYRARDPKTAAARWRRSAALHHERGLADAEASTLANVAVAEEYGGDLRAALATATAVLTLRAALGDDDAKARALARVGALHAATGDLAAAADAYERALPLVRAAGDAEAEGEIMTALGRLQVRRGDRRKALPMLAAAVERARAGGSPAVLSDALRALGHAKAGLGDGEARSLILEALAVAEAAHDEPSTVEARLELGAFALARGDPVAAGASFREADRAAEAAGYAPGRARALAYLGALHVSLGDYPKALASFQKAQQTLEAVGDRAGRANVLGAIGDVHRRLADFGKADDALAEARRLAQDVGDREVLGAIATHEANLLFSRGELERALAAHEAVRTAAAKAGARAEEASAWANVGAVRAELGDLEGATEALEAARGIVEELGDPALARVLVNLGDVRLRGPAPAGAVPLLERSRALCEEAKDRAGAVVATLTLAEARRRMGDAKAALALLDRAERDAERLRADDLLVRVLAATAAARLDLGEAALALETAKRAVPMMERLVRAQGDDDATSSRAQYADLYDVGARAAAARDDAGWVVYFLENGRAGSLLDALGGRDALQAAGLPDELRAAESAARAAETTALHAYAEALERDDLAATRARRTELDAARDAMTDVVGRIQRERTAAATVFYPRAAPLEELQAGLASDEAFVWFGLTSVEAVAVVATSDAARAVRLGPTDAVVAACEALVPNDASADPKRAVATLVARVVTPLELPASVRRVLVSPDGALSLAAPALLFPGRDVVLAPSGTTLLALAEERARRGSGVLAVGDPAYEAAEGGRASRSRALVALPGTRAEVEAVGTKVLVGKEATPARLRAEAATRERWRAIHVACHGLVDVRRPALSALALTPGEGDDGMLAARDVFVMRLPADLAVLSACETGRGRVVRGEGLLGLTRAFMFAGAPRVIVSLWKVDDAATRALMEAFYAAWSPKDGGKGLPASAALRKAQEAVAADPRWKHPYYWAAWVLWGLPD
ncbi:MAG: CHAT domain-containing protein, partial [Planctomycetia bacterium]|nr:CHAT domain-containing protein [Planctomycetia bacterium]